MSSGVDLNKLRTLVYENQQNGQNLPARREEKVLVDRHGNILQGSQVAPGEERHLSEVHQGVFASSLQDNFASRLQGVFSSRLQREASIVAQKFPPGTRAITVDGVSGWLYSIVSELGDQYDLFAYFDGSLYQVVVVCPEVAGRYSTHDGHLYDDGGICFGNERGLSDLGNAYAKSVLWATGFSIFQRIGQFPFSINN